jgi:hypothetical protein
VTSRSVRWLPPTDDQLRQLGVVLPSGESASDFLEGKPGSTVRLVTHLVGRAALLGIGLAVAGARGKELVKFSLAGATAIEAFVLVWAAVNKDEKKT